MADEHKTAPEAPKATPPAPQEVAFDLVKKDTKTELEAIKKQLGVTEENKKNNEWEKMETFLITNKEKIKTITKVELEELRKDINDKNSVLELKLDEKADNEIKYVENISDGVTPTPETSTTAETQIHLDEISTQVRPEYQKEVKNYIVDNGGFAGMVMKGISNWVVEIIKGIKGFFATFGIEDEAEKKDKLAQINGFEDAEEERRVTASVKALKSSPVTKGPPLSDVLKISHISNEDLTKILKDNPGLDFSSNKNMEAAFTGSFLPSEKESVTRYLRIYRTLARVHSAPPQDYTPKQIFIDLLSGSQNTDLDSGIPDAPTKEPSGATILATKPEKSPSSPEVQKDLMAQAIELDKAKNMPDGTPEEKKAKEENMKKVTEFKEARKNAILGQYTDLQKNLDGKRTEQKALAAGKPVDGTEEKKRLDTVNQDIKKLEDIQKKMEKEIATVMDKVGEKWEIKPEINAETMVTAEIAISKIESNTTSTEDIKMSEDEKKNQEKIVNELGKEIDETLYGGNTDWKQNYRIDRPEDLAELEKKIIDAKKYANTDSLRDKISGMEKKIQTAKLKVDAVRAFLTHARGLVIDEKEMPAYTSDPNDFIQFENGIIDINTEHAAGSWLPMSTWSDERWDLSDNETKIAEGLGGKSEFVNVIKANVNGLRNNEGLFSTKKGDTKFTILG